MAKKARSESFEINSLYNRKNIRDTSNFHTSLSKKKHDGTFARLVLPVWYKQWKTHVEVHHWEQPTAEHETYQEQS